jgi:hypothetical protein
LQIALLAKDEPSLVDAICDKIHHEQPGWLFHANLTQPTDRAPASKAMPTLTA